MRKVYRWLAKKALWVVTGLSPVVIAACYGMEYEFAYDGRVVDRNTGRGIEGIQVSCGGGMSYSNWSGDFSIETNTECTNVLFQDVDREENGSYQFRSVPLSELEDDGIVELDPLATP